MFMQESEGLHGYNIKCYVDAEELLKVTGSYVCCESGTDH